MFAFIKKVLGIKEKSLEQSIYEALGYSEAVEQRLIAVSKGRALENYAHLTANGGKFKDRIND